MKTTLKELLTSLGVSQKDLAEKLGYSKSYISKILNGKSSVKAETAARAYLEELAILQKGSETKEVTIKKVDDSRKPKEKTKAEWISIVYKAMGISEEIEADRLALSPDGYEELVSDGRDLYGRPLTIRDPSVFRNRGYRVRGSDDALAPISDKVDSAPRIRDEIGDNLSMHVIGWEDNPEAYGSVDDEEYAFESETGFERVYRLTQKEILYGHIVEKRNSLFEEGLNPGLVRGVDSYGIDHGLCTPEKLANIEFMEAYTAKETAQKSAERTKERAEKLKERMETVEKFKERLLKRAKTASPVFIEYWEKNFFARMQAYLHFKHEVRWPAPSVSHIHVEDFLAGKENPRKVKENWKLLANFVKECQDALISTEAFIGKTVKKFMGRLEGKPLADVRKWIFDEGFNAFKEEVLAEYGRAFVFSSKEQNSQLVKDFNTAMWAAYYVEKDKRVEGYEAGAKECYEEINRLIESFPLKDLHIHLEKVDTKTINQALKFARKNTHFPKAAWFIINEAKAAKKQA